MKVLVLSAVCALAQTQGPNIPSGAAASAGKIADILRAATASPGYTSTSQESSNIDAVLGQMKESMTRSVASDVSFDLANHDAYILAHTALKKKLYNGGCPRDYSACPTGFSTEGSQCLPSSDYTGLCGPLNAGSMSTEEKEAYAWKCAVSWPCSA